MNKDWMRTITAVEPRGEAGLFLRWSDGTEAEIMLKPRIRAALGDNANFAAVRLGDWGHGIEWPSGFDLGADSLWADTLSVLATGCGRSARYFAAHGRLLFERRASRAEDHSARLQGLGLAACQASGGLTGYCPDD